MEEKGGAEGGGSWGERGVEDVVGLVIDHELPPGRYW